MHALSAEEVSQRYRALRPRLLLCMVIGYAAFYLTRKSLNTVLPALQLDLGLSKGDIGLIGSLFYLSYGLSKFADVPGGALARQPRTARLYGHRAAGNGRAERAVQL